MIIGYVRKRTLQRGVILLAALAALFLLWLASKEQPVAADQAVSLPVLMYHSVLKHPSVDSDFIVTPELLESDIRYLQAQGYQFVSVQQLVDHAYKSSPLPEKPLLLTFDDGYLNNLEYVVPLLQKYQAPALIAVVGSFAQLYTDTPDRNLSYAHMNWQDINAALASGYVEIGNHSYNLHSFDKRQGCAMLDGENIADYQALLRADVARLQQELQEHCNLKCRTFVYPYGAVSEPSLPVLQELGFQVTFSTYEKINSLSGAPEDLYLLGRFNRSGKLSTEEFMRRACL